MQKEDSNSLENDWVPCEPGALLRLSVVQKAITRRAALSKVSSAVILLAASGTAATIYVATGKKPSPPSGTVRTEPQLVTPVASISCRKVICLLPEYINDEIQDQKLVARIGKHLSFCNYCSDKRDELRA